MKRPGLIANALTVLRIVLSMMLPFLKPLQTAFLLLYAVCGATDVLDGYIARKTHSQSNLGAKLDSIADLVLMAALTVSLYPVIRLPAGAVVWILAIAAIRLAAALVSWSKHKAFASLHTWGNKLTGLLIFLFPFFAKILEPAVPVWVLCGAATLSAVEELMIQMASSTLDLNRKGIFAKE